MAPKSTIYEEYFWCLCATWACFRKRFQGFRGIRRWKKIKKTRITENRESPRSKRGCLVGKSRVVHVVSSPNRRWSTTAGITLFLYQQEFLLRVGVCWRTITDMSSKWMVGCGFFSKVSHKPPHTNAEDSRMYEAVDGES